jgi:hypothetical protein
MVPATDTIGMDWIKTETPGAHAPGELLSVRSLPRDTSLTAIDWSGFGEEGCEVVPTSIVSFRC